MRINARFWCMISIAFAIFSIGMAMVNRNYLPSLISSVGIYFSLGILGAIEYYNRRGCWRN